MTALIVHRVGPGVAVQDLGRPGWLARGLSQGGAADVLALYEGAALLGQDVAAAALEMMGLGGAFEATAPCRISLTGAEMRATLDGAPIAWNACHQMETGSRLEIGPVVSGTYGYLHVGGGFATEMQMGARSTHMTAGLGNLVTAGDHLLLGDDKGCAVAVALPRDDRFAGGRAHVVESLQTHDFSQETRNRFEETRFSRDPRANRQGIRLTHEGAGFANPEQLSVVSEIITPGDIQIAGDGAPIVLAAESQTTGGYPRIGTILPCDLPRVAQAPPGATLEFAFVPMDAACEIERRARAQWRNLHKDVQPIVRDPRDIQDLLQYRLIDGMVTGAEEEV